jgi:hypothetical protein
MTGYERASIRRHSNYMRSRFAPRPAACVGCRARELTNGERAVVVAFEGVRVIITCRACGRRTIDGKPTTPADATQEAYRVREVEALAGAIDLRTSASGGDPFAPSFAADLSRWPLEAWEDLAEDLGISKPSAETIAQLVQYYRTRSRRGAA